MFLGVGFRKIHDILLDDAVDVDDASGMRI